MQVWYFSTQLHIKLLPQRGMLVFTKPEHSSAEVCMWYFIFYTLATENSQFCLAGDCRFSNRTVLSWCRCLFAVRWFSAPASSITIMELTSRRASPVCRSLQPARKALKGNWIRSKPKTGMGKIGGRPRSTTVLLWSRAQVGLSVGQTDKTLQVHKPNLLFRAFYVRMLKAVNKWL